MKEKIYLKTIKNKGSSKDPSFTFKFLAVTLFIFLLFGLNTRGDNLISGAVVNGGEDGLFMKSGTSLDDFSEIVISQGNTLYVSSPLYTPQTAVLGTSYQEPACQKEIISYKVEKGESLSSIATKFEISTETIIWANNIKNNSLSIGQDIIILPVSGVFHVVKAGETISGVAKKYSADEEEILSCNKPEEDMISVGDILVVPGGKIPKPTPFSAPTVSLNSSGFIMPLPRAGSYISQGLHWYNAVDIANACGTPVYASASGTIQGTGYHPIGGNYVRILHNGGIVTYYGHLSRILVIKGQSVSQGGIIGYVGNTGYTIGRTGCHVHFEARGMANPFARFRVGHRF